MSNNSIDYDAAASGTTWLWGQDFETIEERNEFLAEKVDEQDRTFAPVVTKMSQYSDQPFPKDRRFTWDAYTKPEI